MQAAPKNPNTTTAAYKSSSEEIINSNNGVPGSTDKYDFTKEELHENKKNSISMKKWIIGFEKECKETTSVEDDLSKTKTLFGATDNNKDKDSSKSISELKRCKNVFLDFGSNVGDSVGKFIDTAFYSCKKGKKEEGVRYNVNNFEFETGQYNQITGSFKKVSLQSGSEPHEYCVYGVEGNPVFTERLQKLEKNIMSMSPRPIQNLHMLTEHVGSGTDGPTKLFLDTVNEKHNFWGSSIIESHQDVLKSANELNNGTVSFAPVTGITLSSLMKQSLIAFSPNAQQRDKQGGHLIVKVDIEGGEYPLMEEVAASGVLCDFKSMGNTVDLIVEFHRMSITDGDVRGPLLQKKGRSQQKLEACGVHLQHMSAMWS